MAASRGCGDYGTGEPDWPLWAGRGRRVSRVMEPRGPKPRGSQSGTHVEPATPPTPRTRRRHVHTQGTYAVSATRSLSTARDPPAKSGPTGIILVVLLFQIPMETEKASILFIIIFFIFNYIWHTILYYYIIVSQHLYTLVSDYHNKSRKHL